MRRKLWYNVLNQLWNRMYGQTHNHVHGPLAWQAKYRYWDLVESHTYDQVYYQVQDHLRGAKV